MPEPYRHSKLGSPFIELQSIDSTNNYALGQVRAGMAQSGSTFFAHEQVAGKGQRGKVWTAEKDSSLIISVALKPRPLPISAQFQLSACVAVSVCEFFRKYAGNGAKIKWPNDLYWHDRKAGGILIESIIGPLAEGKAPGNTKTGKTMGNGTAWQWAIMGIGININQATFPEPLSKAVSLRQITGKQFDPVILGKELCGILDNRVQQLMTGGFPQIYDLYLRNLYKVNELVKLKKGNRSFEAVIRTVTASGELIIKHSMEETINSGEVQWL